MAIVLSCMLRTMEIFEWKLSGIKMTCSEQRGRCRLYARLSLTESSFATVGCDV